MDALNAFQQGLGSVHRAREARLHQQGGRGRESSHESDEGGAPRIAHTLTACCRCRQRKTRCDPTLPRCIPCERVGALCEYFDAAKQKRIPRTYVIHLQDRVRELEAELGQYTEEDNTLQDTEDIVRPGGLVRLDENETPRFLGPSSGIAMARLVMEEAKRYTDTRTIRELVPEVSERKTPAHSPSDTVERKKSYPMVSAVAAEKLPSRLVANKLLEVFNQRSQLLTPTLHEPTLANDLDAVYNGSTDSYKNFVVRMVLAISMQKLDSQYAGLADSYYLAAMQYLEDVIRPKDIKTLQCLVLIANYSLLTPTRTAIYYVVGLATRVCEQLGLTEEKSIVGYANQLDPIQMDMRRRLSWIILSMEYGLAHSLGRPNAFATGQDHVDVEFFATVDDENITPNGILPGPESPKKLIAIHFMKMRLLQSEIRRVLYQGRRPEPNNDDHPWFAQMAQKIENWRNSSPLNLQAWFRGRSQTMIVFLFRPSPQVPKPSLRAATMCFDASAENIRYQSSAMQTNTIEITWVFVQTIFMALNTLLWTASYSGVRSLHPKEEFEKLVDQALDMIVKCGERWPGSEAVSRHYAVLARACLRSYDTSHPPSIMSEQSTPSAIDANSPNSDHSSATNGSHAQSDSSSAFGYVFNPMTDHMQNAQPQEFRRRAQQQPSFRSNSIFMAPSTTPDRRFSYFPPEVPQQQQQQQQYTPMPPNTMDSWTETLPATLAEINPQLMAATSMAPSMQPLPEFQTNPMFAPPSAFAFNPQLFQVQPPDQSRHGSLSQQQQIELMESLEAEGVIGIGNYFSMPPIPFEGLNSG